MDSSVPTVQPTQQKQEDIGIARKTLDFLFGTESMARIAKGEASSNDYGMLAFQMATMFVPPAKFLKLGRLLGPSAIRGVQEASLKTIAREGTSTAAREAAQANYDAATKAFDTLQKKYGGRSVEQFNVPGVGVGKKAGQVPLYERGTPAKNYQPSVVSDEPVQNLGREFDAKEYDPIGEQLDIRREMIHELVSTRKKLENPKLSDEQFKILSETERDLRAGIKQSNKLIDKRLPALHITRFEDASIKLEKDREELAKTKVALEETKAKLKSTTNKWDKKNLEKSINIHSNNIATLEHNIEVAKIEIGPVKNLEFVDISGFTPHFLNGEKAAYEEGVIAQKQVQRNSITELNKLAAQYAKLKEIKDAQALPLIERAKLGIRSDFTKADARELKRLRKALAKEAYGNRILQIVEKEIPVRSAKVSTVGEPNLENVAAKRREMVRRSEEVSYKDAEGNDVIVPMRAGGREMHSIEGLQEQAPTALDAASATYDNIDEFINSAEHAYKNAYIHPALQKALREVGISDQKTINDLFDDLNHTRTQIEKIKETGAEFPGQYSQLIRNLRETENDIIYTFNRIVESGNPINSMFNMTRERIAAVRKANRGKWARLKYDQDSISNKMKNHPTGSEERIRLENDLKVISQKMNKLRKVMPQSDIDLASSERAQQLIAMRRASRIDTDTVTTVTKDALREEWKTATPERKAEIEKLVSEKFKTPGRVKKTGPIGVDKPKPKETTVVKTPDTNSINSFRGKHSFLSNMHEASIEINGVKYKSAEHAFQAAKTTVKEERERIMNAATPAEAKRLGRSVTLRKNWNSKRDDVMEKVIRAKFEQNPELAKKLIATGKSELIEGNTWGDTYWGVANGKGENKLGEILMKVRKDLIEKADKEESWLWDINNPENIKKLESIKHEKPRPSSLKLSSQQLEDLAIIDKDMRDHAYMNTQTSEFELYLDDVMEVVGSEKNAYIYIFGERLGREFFSAKIKKGK